MLRTVVGFTGSREGLTVLQFRAIRKTLCHLVEELEVELHHGDCCGADETAHSIACDLGMDIVIHPPTDPRLRAYCSGKQVTILSPKPYLERNRDIVDAIDEGSMLYVCPNSMKENSRSGTWATYRYAMYKNIHVFIHYPDGSKRMVR